MPVDPALAGAAFPATSPYLVTAEKIAAFAEAIGEPGWQPDQAAPPTFAIVVAFQALRQLMSDPGVGIELHRVVHTDQRFVHRRGIEPDDLLHAELSVESVRHVAGADLIATRTEIGTDSEEAVCTAYATLLHRGDGDGS
jgi:MaoC dehydratase-like protein